MRNRFGRRPAPGSQSQSRLYTSTWFRAPGSPAAKRSGCSAYARRISGRWYILRLNPGTVIGPYNRTLNTVCADGPCPQPSSVPQ